MQQLRYQNDGLDKAAEVAPRSWPPWASALIPH
jgi:hypothetical protein